MYLSKNLPITVGGNIDSLKRKPEITDRDIAHMLEVYYAEYVLQSQGNTAPSLADISDIYRESQNLLYSFRKLRFIQQKKALKTGDEMPNNEEINTIFRQALPPEKTKLWDALFPIQYQIRMIGDIRSTMMIVSDIIRRKIDPRPFDGHFMGIDLGTGSGILLAAQSILATRNDFESQELYGIDGNPTIVEMTERFSKKMNWCILAGDTTNEAVWDDIPEGDIACITNENIPSHTGHMAREPFLENMKILWKIRGGSILPETVFFPSRLDIIKSPSFGKEVRYQGTPENKYCAGEIENDEICFAAAGYGNLKESLIPHSITLDGVHMPIEDVYAQGAKRLGKKIGVRRFLSRF